eukprot:1985924-Ditylum_brightwellii.AAC.2
MKSRAHPVKKGGWLHWSKSCCIPVPTLFSTGGAEGDSTVTTVTSLVGEDDPPKEEDIIEEVGNDAANGSQYYTPSVSDCVSSVPFKEIKQVTSFKFSVYKQ